MNPANIETGPFNLLASPTISLPSAETIKEILAQSGTVPPSEPLRPWHRLSTIRREQGLSLTTIAKKLGVEIAEARRQEQETTDLPISQLYRWREILETSIGDLVIEPDEIPTNPIKNRSQLVKMMKSVQTILETTKENGTRIMAEMLAAQLTDLMPELKNITAWPSIGQAREHRDLGQAAYRRFDSAVAKFIEE